MPEYASPQDQPTQPNPHLFSQHRRLEVILSKDAVVTPKGMAEYAEVDTWMMLHSQLIHELTFLGINDPDEPWNAPVVATPDDRSALHELLMKFVVSNRFRPNHGHEILSDLSIVEKLCKVDVGRDFWTLRGPIAAYWQGQYKRDDARLQLLKEIVDEERASENKSENPEFDSTMWFNWIQHYFEGGRPREIPVPDRQDPSAVLKAFHHDTKLLLSLPLSKFQQEQAIRGLRLDFLRGEYPIILGKEDPSAEEMLMHDAQEIAVREPGSTSMDLRGVGVVLQFQRYRNYLAQGLSYDDEEEKRHAESEILERQHQQKVERIRQEYESEKEFLESLHLPEFERDDWPKMLYRIANHGSLNVNPDLRDQVHDHARWLIDHMPEEYTGQHYRDRWGVVMALLSNYWNGSHYPDRLRSMVLQNEVRALSADTLQTPDAVVASVYGLHETFIDGSATKHAKVMAGQDEIEAGRAHQRDLQLIRGLGMADELLRRTETEYTAWLLKGNLPIAADRETAKDREELAAKLRQHVEEYQAENLEPHPVIILQLFCDHWHHIADRPAPRKS